MSLSTRLSQFTKEETDTQKISVSYRHPVDEYVDLISGLSDYEACDSY